MLHIEMKPGAVIPAHSHKGLAEAFFVAEGDFTNRQFAPFQSWQRTRPAHDQEWMQAACPLDGTQHA